MALTDWEKANREYREKRAALKAAAAQQTQPAEPCKKQKPHPHDWQQRVLEEYGYLP